jgi:hypothetical protein
MGENILWLILWGISGGLDVTYEIGPADPGHHLQKTKYIQIKNKEER